ncbi:MAG: YtxH domain-containing protein [Nitrospirae bacterium]|nr:YtxH domain-containing protein [Nitrospirota bacterium]
MLSVKKIKRAHNHRDSDIDLTMVNNILTNENKEIKGIEMVEDDGRKLKRYVLLGSFLGGLVGATVALLAVSQSSEERLRTIQDIQKDLFKPVKAKFNELVVSVGDKLIEAIEEAARKASESKIGLEDEEQEEEKNG